MFSARFEDALQTATDEELYHFFSEFPSSFRGRLINILSELEARSVQHGINTSAPPEAALDDLIWPSETEADAAPSGDDDAEPSSSPASWGIFGAPVQPASSALFGGSDHPAPARPQTVPPLPIPQRQQPSLSSSDPAPVYLLQPAAPQHLAPPVQPQQYPSAPDPVPSAAPTVQGGSGLPSEPAFPHMPARSPTVPTPSGVPAPSAAPAEARPSPPLCEWYPMQPSV